MSDSQQPAGLTTTSRFLKRGFDIVFALVGLLLAGWLILTAYLVAAWDTRDSGFFRQERVGKDGRLFKIIKIRTMRSDPEVNTSVTRADDPRITPLGSFWRKTRIDELPQLINILLGQMSFVGPRPDVPGFADLLHGRDRIVLSVRPGITGPATLHFRHEEALLAAQPDPERYNREIVYPEKVRLNRLYVEHYSFGSDIRYIWQTIVGAGE
jgi:lipopolysaccharide/colanic/teichoic acid biosynthesis glycosyltransferase